MRGRRSYRRKTSTPQPFTEAEDEKLIEITRIGLTPFAWPAALPERTFGEIVDRRLTLQEEGRCPRTPTD